MRGQCFRLPEDETRTKVRCAIADSIKFFDRWNSLFSRRGRAAIAKDAQELAGLIAALESKLTRMTDPFGDHLFGPSIARHTVMPVDDIVAATMGDKATLLEILGTLRLRCEPQQQPPDSSGPEQDRLNDHAAKLARNLMKVFTSQSITGTAEGPYRVIAGLVYEAFTGKPKVDLKRACDRALVSDVT